MGSSISAADRAIALVTQSRELRERTLARRRELQKKTDKMLAHQPYVLKRHMSQQLSLNLDR
jgi:hypothetical protein